MNVLLIGSGGREHALAWKIAQSPNCTRLYCAPGNPGMLDMPSRMGRAGIAGQGFAPVSQIALAGQAEIVEFCTEQAIDLVVIGPEQPLVEGLGNLLRAQGIPVFGHDQAAAELEGSKAFAKAVMAEAQVPTAAYGAFDDAEAAKAFIRQQGAPIVVKADGLAAGKGVVVAESLEQALEAVDRLHKPGEQLVVEAFLSGEEASYFVLVDGQSVMAFGSAQDHKRVGDGDTGDNTGGMGAYTPAPIVTAARETLILETIAKPIARTMAARGCPLQGVLFIGLMIDETKPSAEQVQVLEFNVRFGDPECQVLMLRLGSDVLPLLQAVAEGRLAEAEAPLWLDEAAITVIMANQGYPASYQKGSQIKGLGDCPALVFHAGTAESESGEIQAVGGRVLAVCARAPSLADAQAQAYAGCAAIDWPQGFYRRDIGWRALRAAAG
jgi:phosphoribosylamine--glycine ligase